MEQEDALVGARVSVLPKNGDGRGPDLGISEMEQEDALVGARVSVLPKNGDGRGPDLGKFCCPNGSIIPN
ncbi:hypothetical protein QE152_g35076 [Popillia japonica]|uniref:Uncharacterized protein n=1 Tax=Popillia japonica TaxID=7064 RepID=A0AAW1IRK5_POPJA